MKKAIFGILICMLVIFSSFSIVTARAENTPPNVPSDPNPEDGAIDIGKKTHLSWTGGDPDPGDKAIYDLYFGKDAEPGLFVSDLQMPNYKPDTLDNFTQYFWYVVAKDENGGITPGPVWTFTTNDCDHDPPGQPSGPNRVRNRHRYNYTTKIQNQNQNGNYYNFSWGDGNHSGWLGPFQHNERVRAEHQWEEPGMYQVQARYRFQNGDRDEYITGWSEPLIVEVTTEDPENNAPATPIISGPNNGNVGVEYPYTFTANDPDGDDIYYWIVWGDGCPAVEWIGPYASGEELTVSHSFLKSGKITISAQAKDVYEAESAWGSLDVEMPRARMKSNNFLGNFIYRFTQTLPILRLLLSRLV
jgi:hypothetical protein